MFDKSHRQAIHREVFSSPFFNLDSRADQLRRIKNYDIVLFSVSQHLTHVIERIGLHKFCSSLIEVCVFACQLQRLFVKIDSSDVIGFEEVGVLGSKSPFLSWLPRATSARTGKGFQIRRRGGWPTSGTRTKDLMISEANFL